jgi:hypothetical protein
LASPFLANIDRRRTEYMTKPSFKRPSPALVIAILALFVALGGSAYAAGKIGTKNIKANAITTSKIKKNAITTTKIKNEAITGAKIKESSLGPVPTATNATNATNAVHATNATNAVNATNFSRYFTTGLIRASAGQNVSLFSSGPFLFTGHCEDLGGGTLKAFTTVTTSQAGSSMSSSEDSYYEADFDPGTEARINYAVENTGPETNADYGSYYPSFAVASPDGKLILSGELNSAVNYFGAQCAFWGHTLNNS